MVGRVPKAGGAEGKHLPDALAPGLQKIKKLPRRRPQRANAMAARQRRDGQKDPSTSHRVTSENIS